MSDCDWPHERWDEIRRSLLNNTSAVPRSAPSEAQKLEKRSESWRIISSFVEDGIKEASQRGLDPASYEAADFIASELSNIENLLWGLGRRFPFLEEEWRQLSLKDIGAKLRLTSPYKSKDLKNEIKSGWSMDVYREDVDSSVTEYINGNIKSKPVDRLIIQCLIQNESTLYLREIFYKTPYSPSYGIQREIKENVIKSFFFSLIFEVVLVLVYGGVLFYAHSGLGLDAGTALIIFAVMFLAQSAFLIRAIYQLPRAARQSRENKKKHLDLMLGMLHIYDEVTTENAISVRRVREKAQ